MRRLHVPFHHARLGVWFCSTSNLPSSFHLELLAKDKCAAMLQKHLRIQCRRMGIATSLQFENRSETGTNLKEMLLRKSDWYVAVEIYVTIALSLQNRHEPQWWFQQDRNIHVHDRQDEFWALSDWARKKVRHTIILQLGDKRNDDVSALASQIML